MILFIRSYWLSWLIPEKFWPTPRAAVKSGAAAKSPGVKKEPAGPGTDQSDRRFGRAVALLSVRPEKEIFQKK